MLLEKSRHLLCCFLSLWHLQAGLKHVPHALQHNSKRAARQAPARCCAAGNGGEGGLPSKGKPRRTSQGDSTTSRPEPTILRYSSTDELSRLSLSPTCRRRHHQHQQRAAAGFCQQQHTASQLPDAARTNTRRRLAASTVTSNQQQRTWMRVGGKGCPLPYSASSGDTSGSFRRAASPPT